MLERRGALAQLEHDPRPAAEADLTLVELQPAAAVIIAGWDDTAADEVRAALAALGLAGEVPGPGRAASDTCSLVAWLGPRRWLAVTAYEQGATALSAAVSPECRIDWHSARSWLRLSGPSSERLLDGELPIDLRPAAFPDGAATQTLLGHVDVLIHARTRAPAPAFDLFVGRSFAAHLARDLAHAAALDGLRLRVGPATVTADPAA